MKGIQKREKEKGKVKIEDTKESICTEFVWVLP
jgi:hypothetical protein